MINRAMIVDIITHYLSSFVVEIESKSRSNLLNDNVYAEGLIKNILNICKDWNLENLNNSQHNYPGIDLGDVDKKIGVQVTSTNTAQKIKNTLERVIDNHVDEKFNRIYFVVLSNDKMNSRVDFSKYTTVECSNEHIWTIADIVGWLPDLEIEKLDRLWNYVEKELVPKPINDNSANDFSKNIILVKDGLNQVIEKADYFIKRDVYAYNEDRTERYSLLLQRLDALLPKLCEESYKACKNVFENARDLNQKAIDPNFYHDKYSWKSYCDEILKYKNLEKILEEANEFINVGQELSLKLKVIIDGDDLIDRLKELGVDQTIIEKQFSFHNFGKSVEKRMHRKLDDEIVMFYKNEYDETFIKRIEQEGSQIRRFETKENFYKFINDETTRNREIALICSNQDALKALAYNKYVYSVSLKNDLKSANYRFFDVINLQEFEMMESFNFHEMQKVQVRELTHEKMKDLISNANDQLSHQLLVDKDGSVYINTEIYSTIWDFIYYHKGSWLSGNGYVGPFAASDDNYVKQLRKEIIEIWNHRPSRETEEFFENLSNY